MSYKRARGIIKLREGETAAGVIRELRGATLDEWRARAEAAEAAAAAWKAGAKRYRLRLKMCNDLALAEQAQADQAETERDAALDEARMMQDRLTRLVEGSKAQSAELDALRPIFAAAQRMVSGPYEMTDHAGNILVDPREYQALAQAVAHASRRS